MFGTGPFAVPTFQSLLESDHEVLALVTRPIADSGKRRKTSENPTRDAGETAGIKILDPQSANDDEFVDQLKSLNADLFVVCDYGQILSRACLGSAKLGGINLHGSLLPKYRGAAPINWCIYNGDKTTGITIIHMTPKLDGGPCLAFAETEIGPEETAEEIEPRLAQLGVEPVHQAIKMLKDWDGKSVIGKVQDRKLATKAPRLNKSDGAIDWNRTATQIHNQIRAFQPWPGSFTHWHSEKLKQPMRLIVIRASVIEADGESKLHPGQVVSADNGLVIQTGAGQLQINEIQPAGKRAMPIADFLRGKPPQIGDQMG
jgi:methionyl-tRNA formyltransferase